MSVRKNLNAQELENKEQVQQLNKTVSPGVGSKPVGTRMGTFLNWRSGDDKVIVENEISNRLRNGK